ncbi:hypothetical protein [Streptomyces misionensis]|uniref:hypothetical protein n=1 Tax=Streptomyces misionensis TaxID=67331 RepID=UPI003BAFB230
MTRDKHVPADAVIVDTGNHVPGLRDEHIAAIGEGLTESLRAEAPVSGAGATAEQTVKPTHSRGPQVPKPLA